MENHQERGDLKLTGENPKEREKECNLKVKVENFKERGLKKVNSQEGVEVSGKRA